MQYFILPFEFAFGDRHILGSSCTISRPANETVYIALTGLPQGWEASDSSLASLRGVIVVFGIYNFTVDG